MVIVTEFSCVQANIADYDNIIAGAPTWNTGADEDRSGTSWDQVGGSELGDLSGKTVAVFGLGDSVSYESLHFKHRFYLFS